MSAFFQQNIHFGSREQEEGGITEAVHHLIMLNVLIFSVQLVLHIPFGSLHPINLVQPTLYQWIAFDIDTLFKGYVWTTVSYMFLHAGLQHLFINMLGLYIFGPVVERALGTRQFYIFYFLCGVFGALLGGLTLLRLENAPPVVGASGAAMGVLVAAAILAPDRRILFFPIPIPLKTRTWLLITIALNMLALLNPASNVFVMGHFGGMAVGYLFMKGRPQWTKFKSGQKVRKIKKRPKKNTPDNDPMADAIDNIFDINNKRD